MQAFYQAELRPDLVGAGLFAQLGGEGADFDRSEAECNRDVGARGDFNAAVVTANGTVKAARARLASVDIGGLEVRDVEAMVLPDNVLSENLLGLSYLSRLKRFEYSGGRLLLEQ